MSGLRHFYVNFYWTIYRVVRFFHPWCTTTHISTDVQWLTLNASCMTISGERTEQLDIFCRVTGFTSDFLGFIVVELIRFFHGEPFSCLVLVCVFCCRSIVLTVDHERHTGQEHLGPALCRARLGLDDVCSCVVHCLLRRIRRYSLVGYLLRETWWTDFHRIGLQFCLLAIAQFTITINSNVCPHIRVLNTLMRESYAWRHMKYAISGTC